MKAAKLTNRVCEAHKAPMKRGRRSHAVAMAVLGAAMAAGCVSVNAPNEPIVIELNINIKQEVIYRLAADAGNTIEENPDIF
ncbi:MAG: YnbE family lipoprotein [Croceibacterium sp.]